MTWTSHVEKKEEKRLVGRQGKEPCGEEGDWGDRETPRTEKKQVPKIRKGESQGSEAEGLGGVVKTDRTRLLAE